MKSRVLHILFLILINTLIATSFYIKYSSRISTKVFSSLILDIPIPIRDFDTIGSRYDIFLWDQFGVLHNGKVPLGEAVEVTKLVKTKFNKVNIIVSNTSKRSKYVQKLLQSLGFAEFDGILTSGDMAYDYIKENFKGNT